MALGKVYSFGQPSRGKSKTRRHLTEFWMVEPEVAYATLDDLMELAEGLLTFLVKRCLERRRVDLTTIGRDLTKLEKIDAPFPRITYDEAVAKLQEGHSQGVLENKFEWGGDLGSPDETYLSSLYDRPVMVHRYPASVKAFYMEPDPQRPELALCVDVLAPKATAKSSADRSAWPRTTCSSSAFTITICPKKPSSGILISASTAACLIPALAWASSAL